MADSSPGQTAYEAYKQQSGNVSLVSGTTLPAWEQQRPEIRDAWEAAADAVIRRGNPEEARF